MNSTMIQYMRAMLSAAPNWLTSVLGVLIGMMAAFDVLTFDKLMAFLNALTLPKIYDYCIGLLIASGGIKLYNKQQKVKVTYVMPDDPVELVDQVK